MREHLVGDDHGDRDRDQRLPQLLALVPAEEHLLDDQTDDADHRHRDERREDPLPGVDLGARDGEPGTGHLLLHLVRDVPAEEVERPVRHVDDAHEAEDQREPARDDEQQTGEGEPVQERPREALPVVDRRAEGRRPPVAAELGARLGEHDDVQHGGRRRADLRPAAGRADGSPGWRDVHSLGREPTNPEGRIQSQTFDNRFFARVRNRTNWPRSAPGSSSLGGEALEPKEQP